MAILYSFFSALGSTLIILLVSLVVAFVVKKPLSPGVCVAFSVVSTLVYALVLSKNANVFGWLLVIVVPFVLTYFISRRKKNMEEQ
jgi:hypothetical protein